MPISMNNVMRKRVRSFLKKYDLSEVTLETLQAVIRKQGYTIIAFNDIANTDNVAMLLSALDLNEISRRSKGFTYADSHRRLVFLHEGLSDEEKRMVLAHEEGHIYCEHLSSAPILGRDVVEEHEANEFVHYLLYGGVGERTLRSIKAHKKMWLSAAIIGVLLVCGCLIGRSIVEKKTYYGEYYITSTGNRYHVKNCGYVKGKDSAERLTIEQYESGEYEPCAKCISD